MKYKKILLIGALIGLCNSSYSAIDNNASNNTIDPKTTEGYLKIQRKIQCNVKDGVEATFVWHGKAYSKIPGVRDQHLFDLMGMNVRQCVTVEDAKKGSGYRLVSREIMLYIDKNTGKLLNKWKNPFTGETVEVIHVANDPVNTPVDFGIGRDGKPRHFDPVVIGNTWQQSIEFPLFYHNPLGGNYQKYVGNQYHATEIFDFYGQYDDLLDNQKDSHASRVAWVRLSSWLPWMEMGGRSGSMYFNAQGGKLNSWHELPQLMQDQIHKNYPAYTNAPPLDDARRNETSWTYFKKIFDARNQGDKKTNSPH